MNKPEFEVGETVTFKPFDKAIKAKVKRIERGFFGNGRGISGEDNRIFYELTGINEPLITSTSGLSIVESKFYNFINVLHEQAMEKLAASDEWKRPHEFTERHEVVRDLLEFGYIQCKSITVNEKTGASVCYYK